MCRSRVPVSTGLPGGENYPITKENRNLAFQENDRMAEAGLKNVNNQGSG